MRRPLAGALVLLALCVVPAALAGSSGSVRAVATVATGSAGTFAQVTASSPGAQQASGAVSGSGLSVGSAEARVSGTIANGKASAKASVTAGGVSLFDGLVTASSVQRAITAAGGTASVTGQVSGLVVAGKSVGTVSSGSFDFDGGRAVVNGGTAALVVTLSKPHRGFAAGSSIGIAAVSAAAFDATTVAKAKPRKPAAPRKTPAPIASATPAAASEIEEQAPPAPLRLVGSDRHAFPIAGPASVGDDFHGARQIGPHQGNDVYAPFGTPVVAVADGRLMKVGTLPISGNRLWLRTRGGDEFFYAHMSSFAPITRNGRRVKAGTILGFVGNTGDAEPTPPHLHIEIHPKGSDAVDPHETLLAWQARARREAEPMGRPGALIEVRDFLADE